MSLLSKKWVIKNQDSSTDIIDKLLINRNIDTEEKQRLFFEDSSSNLHDPFLLKDMQKAVDRIRTAIENKEKIMVFGDYDVDGITSTVILYDFLQKTGADVHYTLPNREKDGYGLRDYFIKEFKERKINLIITVDCGIANVKEVQIANDLGIEVIITDHHDVPAVLPSAFAIINPKRIDCEYPNKFLSGSGVAYKLITALAPYYYDDSQAEKYLRKQLGIATMGIIADCMPLTEENRVLAKQGLKSLETEDHPGVKALMKSAGITDSKVTSITIGFYLGPRINAAGRLDSPHHAFELLLGDTEKTTTLNSLNTKRQKIVKEFVCEATAQIEEMGSIPDIIIIHDLKWNVGTLGLIAGKICDTFKRPTIAIQERENEMIGSCRSLGNFDITGFLRKEALDLFESFGGHKLAGGFTIDKDKFSELKKRIKNSSGKYINPDIFDDMLEIDCEIKPEEITFNTINEINKMEPFGIGNPQPTLIIKNTKILNVNPVGKNGNHLQLPVQYGNLKIQAIAFAFGKYADKINPESNYDIAFNLEVNEWNGYKKLQMKVVDMKPSQ